MEAACAQPSRSTFASQVPLIGSSLTCPDLGGPARTPTPITHPSLFTLVSGRVCMVHAERQTRTSPQAQPPTRTSPLTTRRPIDSSSSAVTHRLLPSLRPLPPYHSDDCGLLCLAFSLCLPCPIPHARLKPLPLPLSIHRLGLHPHPSSESEAFGPDLHRHPTTSFSAAAAAAPPSSSPPRSPRPILPTV